VIIFYNACNSWAFSAEGCSYNHWIDAAWCWGPFVGLTGSSSPSPNLKQYDPSPKYEFVIFHDAFSVVFKEWPRWKQLTLHLYDPVGLSGDLLHIPGITSPSPLISKQLTTYSSQYCRSQTTLEYQEQSPLSKVDVLDAPEPTMNTILSSQLSKPFGSICIPALGFTPGCPCKLISLIQMSQCGLLVLDSLGDPHDLHSLGDVTNMFYLPFLST